MRTRIEQDFCHAVGNTLKLLRQRTGIAQERLALDAGLDRSHMSAIERGIHFPTLHTIMKVLPLLEVGFEEFGAILDTELTALASKRPRRRPPDRMRIAIPALIGAAAAVLLGRGAKAAY